jgi:hypothetical protein
MNDCRFSIADCRLESQKLSTMSGQPSLPLAGHWPVTALIHRKAPLLQLAMT